MPFHAHLHFRRQNSGRQNPSRDLQRRRHDNPINAAISSIDQSIQTIVNVVYVTASPTFDGPIGGYITLGVPGSPSPQGQTGQAPQPTQQPSTHEHTSQEQQSSQHPSSSPTPERSSVSQGSFAAASSLPPPTSAAPSTFEPSPFPSTSSEGFNTAALATSPSTTSGPTTTHPGGMSGGAKAGLAFGIILGIGLIAALVLFCYRRKKKQMKRQRIQDDDEKSFANFIEQANSPASSIRGGKSPSIFAPSIKASSLRSVRTASTAPRLSLRPVTQFLPDIGSKRRNSTDSLHEPPVPIPGLAVVPPSPTRNLTPPAAGGSPWARGGSPWERRSNHSPSSSLSNPFSDPINPFGDAGRSASPVPSAIPGATPGLPIVVPSAPAPLNVRAPSPQAPANVAPSASSTAVPVTAIAAAAIAGAAVAGVAAAAAKRNDPPKPIGPSQNHEQTGSPVPNGTRDVAPSPSDTSRDGISTGTAAALAAGAGAAAGGPPPSSVHRVQLDFKPSMEDELELRAGQLVRLLHEYDDGWALCIRLDRSQQGVAPRTCLSARPVKPRPAGGPRGPPGAARGPPPRPMNGGRPMSPAGGRMSPAMGRPMSPANGRMSPSVMQNGRAMSPEEVRARAMSPGPFNRGPRPLSPGPFNPHPNHNQGPRRLPQQRSMSPGPYGGGPQNMDSAVKQGRRRSNSAGAIQQKRNSPPGPSPLNISSGPGPRQAMGKNPPRKPVPGMAI